MHTKDTDKTSAKSQQGWANIHRKLGEKLVSSYLIAYFLSTFLLKITSSTCVKVTASRKCELLAFGRHRVCEAFNDWRRF